MAVCRPLLLPEDSGAPCSDGCLGEKGRENGTSSNFCSLFLASSGSMATPGGGTPWSWKLLAFWEVMCTTPCPGDVAGAEPSRDDGCTFTFKGDTDAGVSVTVVDIAFSCLAVPPAVCVQSSSCESGVRLNKCSK